MKNVIVLKYGGSSLATPEQILQRAKQIKDFVDNGKKVIAVVSAMGKTTNELTQLAQKISSTPIRRELDMLLTTGERVSMSLMSIALNDLGCSAISFTGSQAGIMTEPAHSNASIKELKPIRVEEELNNNKVVIIAGFQGVNPETKEITTLGRGGSDTTAIAFAHHFQAECLILKDVPGVLDKAPQLSEDAQTIEQLSHEQLLNIVNCGAKVIHKKAIELAKELKLNFHIALADDPTKKTMVTEKVDQEQEDILSVNSFESVYKLDLSSSLEVLENWLKEEQLSDIKVLHSENNFCFVTGSMENLSRLDHLKPDCISSIEKNWKNIGVTFSKPINKIDESVLVTLSQKYKTPHQKNETFCVNYFLNHLSVIDL